MEFYHTYNRGVEKRKIFLDNSDYLRGVHDLYEFNNHKAVVNVNQRFNGFTKSIIAKRSRERLINLGVWSFMPNHFHLFSNPTKDNGLFLFHKKFAIGLANFLM